MENPIPLSLWEAQGNVWPTKHAWYHMLRPEKQRDQLIEAGVASFIGGRWLIFPDKWREYCESNHTEPSKWRDFAPERRGTA